LDDGLFFCAETGAMRQSATRIGATFFKWFMAE
jgi:hypothetical protein